MRIQFVYPIISSIFIIIFDVCNFLLFFNKRVLILINVQVNDIQGEDDWSVFDGGKLIWNDGSFVVFICFCF